MNDSSNKNWHFFGSHFKGDQNQDKETKEVNNKLRDANLMSANFSTHKGDATGLIDDQTSEESKLQSFDRKASLSDQTPTSSSVQTDKEEDNNRVDQDKEKDRRSFSQQLILKQASPASSLIDAVVKSLWVADLFPAFRKPVTSNHPFNWG